MGDTSNNKKQVVRKLVVRVVGAIVVVVLGIYLGMTVWHAFHHEETDNAQVEMRIVPILSRISGFVDKIYVDDYANVTRGQLLMVIDSAELDLQLQEMQADFNQSLSDVENARASLTNAEAALAYSRGNLEVIRLKQVKSAKDLKRDKSLFEGNAITQRQMDETQSNFDINSQQLGASEKDVKVAETRLDVLRSLVNKSLAQAEIKKARIEQQKLKLGYCRIYAISDGKLGKRNVDEGQYIQSGTPVFAVVNNQNQWIVANFKENQIRNLHTGQIVSIKIDGYPGVNAEGRVTSISEATGARFSLLPPDNATGNFVKVTQRIPVRIEIIDAPKYKNILRAGMSVIVSVSI